MIKNVYRWMSTKVHAPYATVFLALLSFLESLVLPPVAPVFILFCLENRKRSFLYAGIVTLFSVLGGIAAYFIGYELWETVGQRLVSYLTTQECFDGLVQSYIKYESAAILIGSFSPIPYRLVALSAGFCALPLVPFIIFSLLGRGARYFLVGALLYVWGDYCKKFIDRWFYQLAVLFIVLMLVGFFVVKLSV